MQTRWLLLSSHGHERARAWLLFVCCLLLVGASVYAATKAELAGDFVTACLAVLTFGICAALSAWNCDRD